MYSLDRLFRKTIYLLCVNDADLLSDISCEVVPKSPKTNLSTPPLLPQKVTDLVLRKGLCQGWNQMSIHLLFPHTSHENAKLFKIYKISLWTNIRQSMQTLNTHFLRNIRSGVTLALKKKSHIKLGPAGIEDFRVIYWYQFKKKRKKEWTETN